jgi:hypothetical protein
MAKIQKMWFVECDYDEHAAAMGNAGLPEGEPAGLFSGKLLKKTVIKLMVEDGWVKKGRKWICPVCVGELDSLTPCPDCLHEKGGHEETLSSSGGYYCYNRGDYCNCKRDPATW